MLTSKHLREKLFWKHFPDLEYSKIGPLSHYLFRGTKNLAGVGALQLVTHLCPSVAFQKQHFYKHFILIRLPCLPYLDLIDCNLKPMRNQVPEAGQQERPHS